MTTDDICLAVGGPRGDLDNRLGQHMIEQMIAMSVVPTLPELTNYERSVAVEKGPHSAC